MQQLRVITQTKQIHSICSVGITACRPGQQYPQCGYHGAKGLIAALNKICQKFFLKPNVFLSTSIVKLFFSFQYMIHSMLNNYTRSFISLYQRWCGHLLKLLLPPTLPLLFRCITMSQIFKRLFKYLIIQLTYIYYNLYTLQYILQHIELLKIKLYILHGWCDQSFYNDFFSSKVKLSSSNSL